MLLTLLARLAELRRRERPEALGAHKPAHLVAVHKAEIRLGSLLVR